jgi:hypothetical protein
MGKLKDEATATPTEDIQTHVLTNSEMSYLRLLNLSLQYHTMGQKIMSGFIYYICTHRLGYKEGVNLAFELDFESQENVLTVKLLPAEVVPEDQQKAPEAPAAEQPPTDAPAKPTE